MIIHIVRPHESLSQIASSYHILENDIVSANLHVTDFSRLVAGTKLKIPYISSTVTDILEETESFIRDYYPSFDGKINNVKKPSPVIKQEITSDDSPSNDEKENISKEETLPEEKKPQISKEEAKEILRPRYYGFYGGNIVPNIPEAFIRKI